MIWIKHPRNKRLITFTIPTIWPSSHPTGADNNNDNIFGSHMYIFMVNEEAYTHTHTLKYI